MKSDTELVSPWWTPTPSSSHKYCCQVMTPSQSCFLGGENKRATTHTHIWSRTHTQMWNLWVVSPASKDVSQLHKCPWRLQRAGADFSTVIRNVPNPSCSYSKAHLANLNGFIVLWVLSHPLREKEKTGTVPCKQPWGQKDKAGTPGGSTQSGHCACTGKAARRCCGWRGAYYYYMF